MVVSMRTTGDEVAGQRAMKAEEAQLYNATRSPLILLLLISKLQTLSGILQPLHLQNQLNMLSNSLLVLALSATSILASPLAARAATPVCSAHLVKPTPHVSLASTKTHCLRHH